jgi:hypothetical protein
VPGRWRDPSAFRADPAAAPALHPSRRQALALAAVLALVAGAVTVASYVIRPEKARAFDLFHGSVFLADQNSPVAVDLASGKPTLRLLGADRQVGSTGDQALGVVPLTDHTLLLNEATGEFNIVDNSGFVVKRDGGVPLDKRAGTSSSFGVATGDGQAYVVRTGATGGTDVYLVNQPTVESAIGAVSGVRPRASTTMREAASTAPGGAASAAGALWLLVGSTSGAARHTVRELGVPAGSSAGAALELSDHGAVDGPAAIGAAATAADGSGASVVGVGSAGHIRMLGSLSGDIAFRPPDGVDRVLPTSNGSGRLAFLMHARAGWYVVSVAADGTGARGPTRLAQVPADARLAEPAASNGRLYTLDQADGQLFEIGYDGTVAAPRIDHYPLAMLHGRSAEANDFADGYVFARGPRVVFNSPSHTNALMLFTDGSHAPATIAKSTAVTVNASGGAEALTKSNLAPAAGSGNAGGPPKTRPQDVQPINNKIDCKTVAQKPHVPVITSAVPGSRTVALGWSYPVLDVQDCYPSTYLVSVTLISGDAPQPPSSVRVQSQTGATVSGLFPSTEYDVSVTAFINGQGTTSQPVRITTGKEGPAAPTKLAVSADSSGNWTIDFDSCGSVEQGCVAAQSWTITPSFCDGRGVSAPARPVTVTADPTARRQPTATYASNDDLLGRGLQFEVQGTGDEGEVGAPSAKSRCVYSWTAPVATDLAVTASTPPQTAGSTQQTTTTARVTFAQGPVHDLGGVGGTLTYELLHGGTVVTTVGPTTRATATLTGVLPGGAYQVRVLARPPRHPGTVATVGPVDVAPAFADWPQLRLDAPSFDAPAGSAGTLHVRFTFADGTELRGETFDLVNSQLSCGGGNTAMPLDATDVALGDSMTFPVNRATFNGPCAVSVQLVQNPSTATNPPLFGAGTSKPATSQEVQIDPPSLTSTASDFTAQWAGTNGQPTVIVSYHGGDDLGGGARNWQMTLSNGSGPCGIATDNPPPATIDVDKSCIKQGGTFTVAIEYTYFLISHAHFDVPVNGNAPSPIDPTTISFDAAWNTNAALPQVDLTYTGSAELAALAPLDWTEVVTSSVSPGVTCGSETDNPADSPPRINVDLTACPPLAADGTTKAEYTVTIAFTDPNYGQTGNYPVTVQGDPPA